MRLWSLRKELRRLPALRTLALQRMRVVELPPWFRTLQLVELSIDYPEDLADDLEARACLELDAAAEWRQLFYEGWAATLRRANVLRASGVRLDISEKNVGRRKYSFNALQLRFMPDVYRPPTECIDNMVTSTIKRDTS